MQEGGVFMKEKKGRFQFGQMGGLIILAVVISAFFGITTKGVLLSSQNISNILVSASLNGVIGIGMTFVLITGGIDLSVTGNIIMTSLFLGSMMLSGMPWFLCLLIALVIGSAVGLVNGISIGRFGMVAFVVTMAMNNITSGIGKLYTDGLTQYGFPKIHEVICKSLFGVIPGPVIMMAVVAVVAFIILKYTDYGRQLYAVGGNPKAAWMSGINNRKIIMIAYVISGFLCGLGAILMTSKLMSASSGMVTSTEMDAIAAAVLGGTSLAGGVGSVGGTIIGAITIAMITNGLNLMGVSPFAQQIVKGVIIFAVVAIDSFQKSRRSAE